jgi:hypothetical protein
MATTGELLDEITDTGKFEALATAILRSSNPAYAALVHTGINAAGKTIASPVDGIVSLASTDQIIVTGYTTISSEKLRGKWLDPEVGDAVKGIKEIQSSQPRTERVPATLILATNRAPNLDLIKDVGKLCFDAGVKLDLWERSRLTAFLDNDPEGQWLRQSLLGVAAQRISPSLLMDLSARSLKQYETQITRAADLIPRRKGELLADRITSPGLTLLSSPSGHGKSALCLQLMRGALIQKRPALWLPGHLVEREDFRHVAIHRVLEELHGSALVPFNIDDGEPLLVIIDDVNKTSAPRVALEKTISWSRAGNAGGQHDAATGVHLLVPVWPSMMHGLRQDVAKEITPDIVELAALDVDEAISVYRIRTSDRDTSELEVAEIVQALGYDPLLIDLHDTGLPKEKRDQVIQDWITRQIQFISTKTSYPTSRYRAVFRNLAIEMLLTRSLVPSASQVEGMLAGYPGAFDDLVLVMRESNLCSWQVLMDVQHLQFRHDRIRDTILADALGSLLDSDPNNDILRDPFYTDFFGTAIVHRQFDALSVESASRLSRLALFAAMQQSGRSHVPSNGRLIEAIENLVAHQKADGVFPTTFFWAVGGFLARTDAPEVTKFCDDLPIPDFLAEEARVRNGQFNAILNYAFRHPLSLTYEGRDRLLLHVADKYPHFMRSLARVLTDTNTDILVKRAALLVAGFTNSKNLACAVEACIAQHPLDDPRDVEAAIWAITQCCRINLESLLDTTLSAFSSLSADRPDNASLSPREYALLDLGGRRIAEFFPEMAVPMLIDQCIKRPAIASELECFLSWVDDPRAQQYSVRTRAKGMENAKKEGQETTGFWMMEHMDVVWINVKLGRTRGRRMGPSSRKALEEIWLNPQESDETRQLAFERWCKQISHADLPLLRGDIPVGSLRDRVLRTRVGLGDHMAYTEYAERLSIIDQNQVAGWLGAARGAMSRELSNVIENCIVRFSEGMTEGMAEIISELLMELPPPVSGPILEAHWDELMRREQFFQAALFIGTRTLLNLASLEFQKSGQPREILEHVVMRFGFGIQGRSERVAIDHLENLYPYLDFLSLQDLSILWRQCNQRGWYDWRRHNLDPRIVGKPEAPSFDVESRYRSLDQLASYKRIWSEWISQNFIEIGYSIDQSLTIIAEWAHQRSSAQVRWVASTLFMRHGNRRHLTLLKKFLDDPSDKASVEFAVMSRTLS